MSVEIPAVMVTVCIGTVTLASESISSGLQEIAESARAAAATYAKIDLIVLIAPFLYQLKSSSSSL